MKGFGGLFPVSRRHQGYVDYSSPREDTPAQKIIQLILCIGLFGFFAILYIALERVS